MNNLQTKIDLFLSGTPEIPRDIIFTASQMFNEKLSRFNYKKLPSKSGLPSLSQIGKPMCQLQASKLGWKEEDKPINFKMMMTYGDMTEVLTVAVLLAAGIEITDMNKKVKLPTKVGDLYGELDLVLQLKLNDYHQVGEKSVWDIKSASSWSFDKRFATYDELKKQDDFGYCCQLFGYAKAEGVKAGGWIVVNKGTGEIKVIEADPGDQEHYINLIEQKALQISKTTEKVHFEKLYDDKLETYYKKSTGNRKLQAPCIFCDYKFACWEGLKYVKNPVSKAGNYEYYTNMARRYETVLR